MKVFTRAWSDQMRGSSTGWATLPTKMGTEITVPDGVTKMFIFVEMSRVQHDTPEANTQFRIMAENTQVAITNTGNACSWGYRTVSFNGVYNTSPGKNVDISVEYKTQRGTVLWENNNDGTQDRQITVLMF